MLSIFVLVACASVPTGAQQLADQQDRSDFFEQRIRPILVQRCGECHIENESGGLSLASRDSLIKGGDSGAVLVPGDPHGSSLTAAIRRETDTPMPPEESLNQEEVAAIEAWIADGAVWSEVTSAPSKVDASNHWAFQPVKVVGQPQVSDESWCLTPVDSFILHGLERSGLSPSPEATRTQWLRRATYTLTGLSPTLDEIASFTADQNPESYEQAIERLLASPRYGQHQARLWLDLARYSDTKGYVYGREERFWLHAWNYRDWVVDAFNRDLPYDRFLMLQLAADQAPDVQPEDLAAMGFLTLGRRFLGVKHDIIDDRIDLVCRTTMGLTVACARCHHHKFDPIPTTDYYSLYGVFDSSSERIKPLSADEASMPEEVQQKRQAAETTLQQRRAEQAKRVRDRTADYLWAQTELHKYPADGFDQIFAKSDLLPSFVRRWQSYLEQSEKSHDRLLVAWYAYRKLDQTTFGDAAAECTERLQGGHLGPVHPAVLNAFTTPPANLREVADRYGRLFQEFEQSLPSELREQVSPTPLPKSLAGDPDVAELYHILFSEAGPCQVPNRSIVHTESFFDSDTCNELWKLQGDLERAIIAAGTNARFAITLVDNPQPINARVFRRGNPLDQGDEVPRHFLTSLSNSSPEPFQQGSGRFELASRIIDPSNPLTARVIVNRIWAQHFGRGLVTTPSDFGVRSRSPSHPELLDYLAAKFVAERWSLKSLHRWLLLSATFRQDSHGPSDPELWSKAMDTDAENRLLWRMNPHRLTFEELRDSLLDACGTLDDRSGGPASPQLQSPFSTRRTLYGLIDRQFLPSSFRVFDFASPDLHIPARNETIIPQQSLFLMNHPLVIDQVTRLATDLESMDDQAAQVDSLFQRILRRMPTDQERAEAMEFLSGSEIAAELKPLPTVADWQYGYGAVDESTQRVLGFTPLPHFIGEAWQGGASFPDATLGWVQLSARGGHPGNDRQHACVRRWTAPRSMTISINSLLQHQDAPGDGIRAFIVSDRAGILSAEKVHQRDCPMNLENLSVVAGETIDFVVDIDQELNTDQYLWSAKIQVLEPLSTESSDWDSQRDFTPQLPQRLSALAQLAQIMLCTNEFMFVD